MFDQTELVWRYLSGLDATARQEFVLTGQVVDYWQDRWRAELKPEESALADGVAGIQRQIVAVSRQRLPPGGCRPPRRGVPPRPARAQGPAATRAHPDEPGDLPARPRVQREGSLQPARGDPGGRRPHAVRPSSRSRWRPGCWRAGSSRAASPDPSPTSRAPWRSSAGAISITRSRPPRGTRSGSGPRAGTDDRAAPGVAPAAGPGGEARLHR